MSPKISVLMTVYNGLPYLKEAIESTLNQTFTDFEFLIIDDASTDESVRCIESYKDGRIRLVRNERNIGQTASLNKGLGIAEGEFIARLDQDDANLPKRLEEQVKLFDRDSTLTVACSWEYTIDSTGRRVRDWTKTIPDFGAFLGEILLGLCPVWHPSVMFRKKDVLDLKGFDVSYGPAEDYELWSRIAMERLNATVATEFHLLQRVHESRQSNLQAGKQMESRRRAHCKVVRNFLAGDDTGCVAALLRLERDPCGKGYDREHVESISRGIAKMLDNARQTLSLTDEEFLSLKGMISSRVGRGAMEGHGWSFLPTPVFHLLFYALSPLLLPRMRPFLSGVNKQVQEMRYLFRR